MPTKSYALEIDKKGLVRNPVSQYLPTGLEKDRLAMIRRHFTLSDQLLNKPRLEFNDLSVLTRKSVDKMSFNTYQPNNGDPAYQDIMQRWRSNAKRPVVRNKVVAYAAYATGQLLFPKIQAFDSANRVQKDSADVMELLQEWSAVQSKYEYTMVKAVLTSLWSPASIVHTQYAEAYRQVTLDGKKKLIPDEEFSGFQDNIVPVDELYIENFYEHDLQKQQWIIWRRIKSWGEMVSRYGQEPNFKYVTPGVKCVYNEPTQVFYEVFDTNLTNELCEEVIYWNRTLDLKLSVVNGVMMSDPDQPNPRRDKKVPFAKLGYQLIDEGKCFYYKSMAFLLQQDANVLNSLYQMIMDGTFLAIKPPIVTTGGETITSDVIYPGGVTSLQNPESTVTPIQVAQQSALSSGLAAMQTLESSLNDSSQSSVLQNPSSDAKEMTAFEVSKRDEEAKKVLGIFVKMIAKFVQEYGELRKNDILQYLTIADADKILGEGLVYKTFLIPEASKRDTTKVEFTGSLPDEASQMEMLALSSKVADEEKDAGVTLYKVNPSVFRNMKFMLFIAPDFFAPLSEEATRRYSIELYDRLVANPLAAQDEALKLLLESYAQTRKDPDKFIKDEEPQQPTPAAV